MRRRWRERQQQARAATNAPLPAASAPAAAAAAPPVLTQGARVALRQPLPDVPSEALGRIVQLDGSRAVVQFDRYSPQRRVPLAQLVPLHEA